MARLNDHIMEITERNIRRSDMYRVTLADAVALLAMAEARIAALENAVAIAFTTGSLIAVFGGTTALTAADFTSVVGFVRNKTLVRDRYGTLGLYIGTSEDNLLIDTIVVSADSVPIGLTTGALSTTIGGSVALDIDTFATVAGFTPERTLVLDSTGALGVYTGLGTDNDLLVTTITIGIVTTTSGTLDTTIGNSTALAPATFTSVVGFVANQTLVYDAAGTLGIYTGIDGDSNILVTTLRAVAVATTTATLATTIGTSSSVAQSTFTSIEGFVRNLTLVRDAAGTVGVYTGIDAMGAVQVTTAYVAA